MPSIINLKFKGNKSFVAFSNLGDTESLAKTWKVCSKVASYLEQGERLENLSWRLWHLQSLIVDSDDAKSRREFKKLSKCMGDKLDKEKGRSIEELEAPDFKRNSSTEMIRQRAVEKERSREASQNAKPGTIKRMQFTFSVDQPVPVANHAAVKIKPKESSNKRGRPAAQFANLGTDDSDDMAVADDEAEDDQPLTQRGRKPSASSTDSLCGPASLCFPSFFSNGFSPSAGLHQSSTLSNYCEGVGAGATNDNLMLMPRNELPLDDFLSTTESTATSDSRSESSPNNNHASLDSCLYHDQDKLMQPSYHNNVHDSSSESSDEDDMSTTTNCTSVPPMSQAAEESLRLALSSRSAFARDDRRSITPIGRPHLTVRTQATPTTRSSGPGATATSVNPAVLRCNGTNNSAPGGVKAECSNCGATHTPLWRRGLNDELNCNACGLYCKLHKRPRPKSMRNTHGEGRAHTAPRQEAADVIAQCYNCHTTATPLWRKDDEGKTVCNACGLYYKLHGSSRPISMKSDVIRKRSRHDARRAGPPTPETSSTSPGDSRRPSPSRETSPTLAPDSTTQMSYDYSEESDYRPSQSELNGALGQDHNQTNSYANNVPFPNYDYPHFPGPYHPDYMQQFGTPNDALPFSNVDTSDMIETESRTNKRRRMSVDSASEPPSSAVSYSSYNDGYSSQSSTTSHSQRNSMEFPFSYYPSPNNILRGSASTLWHPPMLLQDKSPPFIHPPMLPPEESPMDYLHPPMLPQDEDNLFSAYLHPPMLPPDDFNNTSMHSNLHPPMLYPNDSIYTSTAAGQSDFYDSQMHAY